MTYFDWNVAESLAGRAKALGWQPHSPSRFFIKHPSELKKLPEFSSVASDSSELLRQAAKRMKLIDATQLKGFEKDVGLIRKVAEEKAFFEMPLKALLHAHGTHRAQLAQKYMEFVRACNKHDARVVFSSQAESGFDLKSPFEVIAVLQQLGLTREQAKALLERKVME